MRMTGRVLRFGMRGYGWALLDGTRNSVFFHIRDVRNHLCPQIGDRIEFNLEKSEKGLRALDIELLSGVRL